MARLVIVSNRVPITQGARRFGWRPRRRVARSHETRVDLVRLEWTPFCRSGARARDIS
jgi:hypothetical protein